MTMWWLDFIALFLAVGAVVNAWLKEDGLFSDFLGAVETWGEPTEKELAREYRSWWQWVRGKIAYLLNCRVCLSYWVAFILTGLYGSSLFLSAPWSLVARLPIYAFASARASILIGLYVATWNLEEDPETD